MARARSVQRFQRKHSPTSWTRAISASYVTVAANTKVLLGTFASANPGIALTIRRTRGLFNVVSDQSAAVEEQLGALGLMVINDIAVAAGAASIPGPVTDADDDGWFVWQGFVQQGQNVTGAPSATSLYEFDSKAMRKIEPGFSNVFMCENSHATHGLRIAFAISQLVSIT